MKATRQPIAHLQPEEDGERDVGVRVGGVEGDGEEEGGDHQLAVVEPAGRGGGEEEGGSPISNGSFGERPGPGSRGKCT